MTVIGVVLDPKLTNLFMADLETEVRSLGLQITGWFSPYLPSVGARPGPGQVILRASIGHRLYTNQDVTNLVERVRVTLRGRAWAMEPPEVSNPPAPPKPQTGPIPGARQPEERKSTEQTKPRFPTPRASQDEQNGAQT